MSTTPEQLMREYVNSQTFSSTTEVNAMKSMFGEVLQQVMESKLEQELGYERSNRISNNVEKEVSKNYRNGYSKKAVKAQLSEVDIKIPRDRNGEYKPKIISKYNRNADGMEEKILSLSVFQNSVYEPTFAYSLNFLNLR